MRALCPIAAAAMLTGACSTLRPGQADPTRYPWDQRTAKSSYCIMSLEIGNATGITVGGRRTVNLACKEPSGH